MLSERTRLDLHRKLEEVLGAVHADTLMEHLPPSGWGDVATKEGLATLRLELDAVEQRLRRHLAEALAAQTRTIMLTVVFALVGAVLTTAAVAFAALR